MLKRPGATPWMGSLRIFVVLAMAVIGGVVPAAIGTPAGAEDEPVNPFAITTATTAFTTNPDPIVSRKFQIVGQVFLMISGMTDDPIPFPDRTVILERRVRAADPWVRVATAKTAEQTLPDGKKHVMFRFDQVARRTASFRVRFEGMSGTPGSASASDDGARGPMRVRVHRAMPVRLRQPRPSVLYLAGSVKPLYAKQRVVVLRKTCLKCTWKTFARTRTNAKGGYRVRLSTPRKGSHYFIARARASKGFAMSYSQQARIRHG